MKKHAALSIFSAKLPIFFFQRVVNFNTMTNKTYLRFWIPSWHLLGESQKTLEQCEIRSRLTINIPERRQ